MDDINLFVASWDDREDLVVELTTGQGADAEDWGLVSFDEAAGRPVIDLYPRRDGKDWRFDLDDVRNALETAHRTVLEVAAAMAAEKAALAQHD